MIPTQFTSIAKEQAALKIDVKKCVQHHDTKQLNIFEIGAETGRPGIACCLKHLWMARAKKIDRKPAKKKDVELR